MEQSVRWRDWLIFAFGLWLLLSPYLFAYGGHAPATVNAGLVGAAVVVLGAVALRGRRPEEWIHLAIGLWLIVAPFTLGFRDLPAAAWTQVGIGLLIGGDALWTMQNQFREPA